MCDGRTDLLREYRYARAVVLTTVAVAVKHLR